MTAVSRPDCMPAHAYPADALDNPSFLKLSAALTVAAAGDDPDTAALLFA